LDWIASENIQEISAKYDISDEVVRGILNQIKACHPKPGQLLQPDKTEYIIPEAYIYKSEGKWQVSFYKWSTPIIQVDPTYQSVEPEQKEAYAFLTRKHKEIVKLNRAFAYRATTLERVVHVIMQKQQLYFEYGIH
ncbi:RNA polymerase sigma-54 factor, partial [Planococcus sp. SIMBA_143]